jgi:exopolyphosphatase/pppGpp-phosphohydrolase
MRLLPDRRVLSHRLLAAVTAVLLLAAAAPAVFGQSLHGGIEIGAKGVKATVVKITPGPSGNLVEVLLAKTANTSIAVGVGKTGKFSPSAIQDTAAEVERFYLKMVKDLDVPKDNVHIVGSSGIPLASNREQLIDAVRSRTGLPLTFIDVKKEIELSIRGVVPAAVRRQALFLDIGSGNTKGGCYTAAELVTLEAPFGTVTFTDHVKKGREGEAANFSAAAAGARKLLDNSFAEQLRRQPRLGEPTQVYLSGGIVWALVTVLHPATITESYVELTAEDFDKFADLLARNAEKVPDPDLSGLPAGKVREALVTDLRRVRDTFTRENLIAGTEILRSLASTLDLKKKKLLFARHGYLAWITSYVVPEERTHGPKTPVRHDIQ